MKKHKSNADTEVQVLKNKPDSEVLAEDIPETTDWHDSQRSLFYRPIKQPIHIRIDADVLDWFKTRGKGYQTKMNQALREFMERHND